MNATRSFFLLPGVVGFLGMLGHLSEKIGNPPSLLIRWGDAGAVTMKPLTCLCLMLVSLILLSILSGREKSVKEMGVFLILTIVAGFYGVGVPTDEAFTIGYNVPSIGTFAGFCFVALGALIPKARWFAGAACVGIGACAGLGHILAIPAMFFFLESYSTGMAQPTSFGFLAIGGGLLRETILEMRTNSLAVKTKTQKIFGAVIH